MLEAAPTDSDLFVLSQIFGWREYATDNASTFTACPQTGKPVESRHSTSIEASTLAIRQFLLTRPAKQWRARFSCSKASGTKSQRKTEVQPS
jgi:hypothetical protein